ncbi:MAG: class II glutamine amidotransferase, partial [Actinobacteria bacterium]|nr:class II glutamine amidotransferase [Actinomycetota bacterium]
MSAGERSDVCGIVGVVGDRPAAPLILEALRALEYRGYDSAGLAVLGPEGIQIRRRAGKLDGLAELVAHDAPAGSLGIGHTRWATHGAVTDANAHPHRDASGTIALVHNGILDNFAELKARLVAAGHRFVSETDTEVIAHVIGEARERGADLPAAMRSAMGQLQGAHALLALAADAPDQVVAARVGTAGGLVVGFTAQGALVASDLPAVVRYTRQVQ